LKFILYSQVANGILLPFVLVYMLLLVNRSRLMGTYKNNWWQNVIAWGTAGTMILLASAMVYTSLAGG
jgi:Mn2+/Fe2+ NRAMP family transporter